MMTLWSICLENTDVRDRTMRYVSFFIYYLIFFALSIERTCPDLHFTTDYILYNWVCDE